MKNGKNVAINHVSVITEGVCVTTNVLADPETLLVFSGIVMVTSKARVWSETGSPIYGTSYITLHGLERSTSLPQDVIKKALQRLEQAGLLETNKHRNGWRVNETALVAALA
jgi:hypothetical protein